MLPRLKTPIHYLVIGPLRSASALNPIRQMEKCVDRPIELACLSKDSDVYRRALRDTKVKVKPVESYLEEGNKVKQFAEISKRVRKIQTIVLENSARNKVVDRVAFKELFAFYLLALKGGFTMDTNVHPATKEKKGDGKEHKVPELKNLELELPEEKQFCYPWYITPELWMLYAPPNDKVALDILTTYLNNWDSAQEPLAHWIGETYYPYRYHLTMQHLSLDAMQGIARSNGLKELSDWQFTFSGSTTVHLKGINVEKTYGNSHKHPEHLAGRIDMFFRDRYATENKDPMESEFKLEALIKISEDFKKQLIDDINCYLVFFNKKFTTSTAFSPLTQLKRLLAQRNVTYTTLIAEVTKLKRVSTEETIFLKTIMDPQKLWIKNMTERIENNFKERTTAMQVMQPIIVDALKTLNKVSRTDDVTLETTSLNGMTYKVVNFGLCCSMDILNPDGACVKSIRLMGACVDLVILPNGHVAVSLLTSSICDVTHVSIIDPFNHSYLHGDNYRTSTPLSPCKKYVALLPDGNIAMSGGNETVIKIYHYSMFYDEIYKKERFKLSLIDHIKLDYYLDSKEELLVELEKLLIKPDKSESPLALPPPGDHRCIMFNK